LLAFGDRAIARCGRPIVAIAESVKSAKWIACYATLRSVTQVNVVQPPS
jgi:hypothetical protein